MKSLSGKFLPLVMITAILIMSIGPSVAAAEEVRKEEKEIQELSKALEFIFEEAAIKDETGKMIDIDAKKVRKEFPPTPELNKLLAEIQKAKAQAKAKSNKPSNITGTDTPVITTFGYHERFNACAADKLGSYLGDFVPIFVIGSIFQYLADEQYYKAASKLVKAGLKGSVWGIAATLSWITIECTWEQRNY